MTTKDNISRTISYADSGVSIDTGNALIERIKPAAKSTMRMGSMDGLGGFGGLFDLKACGYTDPILVSATDGVGTKLKLAFATGNHSTVGIDLVAMCVNDLIVQGAEPLFFLDYFACGSLKIDQAAQVIEGIAEGCRQAACQLIGGETAEMPGMYHDEDYDLAGFAVGAVERTAMLPKRDALQAGDVIIGLASSGLHSNGFSLVRRLIESESLALDAPAPFDASRALGDALLTPTCIYVKSCLPAIKAGQIKALAHITGGGLLENIPRVLPAHLGCEITLGSWALPPVFSWILGTGKVAQAEMLRTFNCGIGMIVITAADTAQATLAALNAAGESASIIGQLTPRAGEAVHCNGTLA